jgi:hypothetical protein
MTMTHLRGASLAVALLAILMLVGGKADPAEARSYAAKAVNKANRYAFNRYRSAMYIQSECFPAGYQRAQCRIDITKSSSSCSVLVNVSGPNYRVRRFDSTC